ncbi:biotin carboxylase N-terminal domain-containing protein [Pelomonas sp. KK5]|uniref:acetyl/propionyl/methylcrotonyl-CoA carboxylase subunit alpha n=1 Tax=Pelomonas sp. KK5 TaxID=1855730 RepID=UPI00097BD250|nr:biotin carboxylase N-terminal domain-containing protein [Pelomonas sp. KK5]
MKKVLIANRGEIAVRITRACRDYGVKSVAVYADADATALHVEMADEAFALEGERPADTYLSIDKLIAVAQRSGADAIHPGYGFLSESAAFARAVIGAGLAWIGPPPAAIEQLGDKVAARTLALAVGAPLVAGTPGPVDNAQQVLDFAAQHGLPIAIKAAFGGGGRGLKVAWKMDEVAELYESAVREATAAFGRGECFVEQYLDKPRHVEAQVIADTQGHVVVLGTRDCSLQRRNQKLVEEAPAPFITNDQNQRIVEAAEAICRKAGYVGAGTVEFLLSRSGAISFLEVNTRLQVEHPVTELTSGVDLVVEQLRVADGLPLSFDKAPATIGHAIEFRINAEDVGRGFLPAPGPVTRFEPPSGPGVRVDAGVRSGGQVAAQFDSLMAKLVVHGATREQALARARRALAEFRIDGVPTVLPFHRAVVEAPAFAGSDFQVHTRWIETEFREPLAAAARPDPVPTLRRVAVEIDGRRVMLGLPPDLLLGAATAAPAAAPAAEEADPSTVLAPMSGTLLAWLAEDGATVAAGEPIAVIEAMKMETQILAPQAGRLQRRAEAGAHCGSGTAIGRVS